MDLSLQTVAAVYIGAAAAGWALACVNLRHLEATGDGVPEGFEGVIDRPWLARMKRYAKESSILGLVESAAGCALTVVFVLFLLGPYDRWVASLGLSFVAGGEVFFLVLLISGAVLSAPFSLWRAFVTERRYGFSNMTARLWAADFARSLAVSAALGAALIGGALWTVRISPGLWWLLLWGFFLAFSVFVMYLSPRVIEPLFNRFEEIGDEELRDRIRDVLSRAGIRVEKVLRVDASRRTAHTNAYFTGIGNVKRIVLYDTLMEKLDAGELVAVLAHEAGHWKGRHLLKGLVVLEAAALAAFYISYRLIEGGVLDAVFGTGSPSFFAKAALAVLLAQAAAFPLTPLFSWMSRRLEREADRYAVELSGDADALAAALAALSKDNLSNLFPHPLYAAFYYTHPPTAQRIKNIREMGRR